jgi:RNA polymerase sigma-70 factor, ECF subfamily
VADVDKSLVQAARRGDADAWDELFRVHQLPLYVFVLKMVRNETTALDIVQETFIAATRYLGSLKEDGRFLSWMFSIARQKSAAHWRRSTRDPMANPATEEIEKFEAVDEIDPTDFLVAAEQEQFLQTLLDRLPGSHREVLILFFLEEFSLEEISEITECPVGTVKSRLHYAKKSLRKLIENEDEIAEGNPVATIR